MRNKKLILLIVLSAIAAASLMRAFRTPSKTVNKPAQDGSLLGISGADTAKGASAPPRTAKRSGYDSWSRSPFIPKEVSVKTNVQFTLNGIVWDEISPTAIINNDIVGVGDKIENAVILDIKKNSVKLKDGDEEFTLSLEEE